MLRSRKQDIVYKLFEWPRYAKSPLIVLGIANTMDLPERILAGRVNSRCVSIGFSPSRAELIPAVIWLGVSVLQCKFDVEFYAS